MRDLLNTYKEGETQLNNIDFEKYQLQEKADQLNITSQKTQEEFNSLTQEYERLKRFIEIKSRTDKATLRLRVGQLEAADTRNTAARQRLRESNKLNRDTLVESANLIETLKSIQNERMNVMMSLIEQNVQKTERLKQDVLNKNAQQSAKSLSSGRRRSSFSALLENYDPRVKQMLKQSLSEKPTTKAADKDTEDEHDDDWSDKTKQIEYVGGSKTSKGFDAGQFEDYDGEEEAEDIDSQHQKTMKPGHNRYPRKGEDYMSKPKPKR